MDSTFVIKKTMSDKKGKQVHVFITDGQSEVLELSHRNIAEKLASVMQDNSDSGWTYEVVEIASKPRKVEIREYPVSRD